jgi:hypothetical protein
MNMRNFIYYVLLPGCDRCEVLQNSAPPFKLNGTEWMLDESCALGGCFYDYIRDAGGEVAGIRYWIGSQGPDVQDTAFRNFLTDKRFIFSKDNIFVDILFDVRSIEPFRNSRLVVDDAQDFGGEFVVANNAGATGIGFRCEIE